MTPLAQRLADRLGLNVDRYGVLDAATYARARRWVRRGLAVRVYAVAIFVLFAVVCLIRSQIAAAAILLVGAVFMFGSAMLCRFLLIRMREPQ
jgi:hypothetical protein